MTEPPIKRIRELEKRVRQLEESNLYLMQQVDHLNARLAATAEYRNAIEALKIAFDQMEQEPQ